MPRDKPLSCYALSIIGSLVALALVKFQVISATYTCLDSESGRGPVGVNEFSGTSIHRDVHLDSYYDKQIYPLITPACIVAPPGFEGGLPLNITYNIRSKPEYDYLIISGNITGPGRMAMTDNMGSKVYNTDFNDKSGFVFHPTQGSWTLSISYYTDSWTPGNGPSIELFFAPVVDTTECPNVLRRCSVTVDHQFICLPNEWRCNGRQECLDAIDESECANGAIPKGAAKCDNIYTRSCQYQGLCSMPLQLCNGYMDCPNGKDELGCGNTAAHGHVCADNQIMCPETGCFTMAERCDGDPQCSSGYDERMCDCCTHSHQISKCSSPSSCTCDSYLFLDYNVHLPVINGCNGQQISQPIPSTQPMGYSSLPIWPQAIPYNISYDWSAVNKTVNLTLTFNQIAVSSNDVVTLHNGNLIMDLRRLRPGMKTTVSLRSGDTPRLNLVLMSPQSAYNFTYQLIPYDHVSRGAAPCDNIYARSCLYKDLCYMPSQVCNDYMDCPNGRDELGCGTLAAHSHVCAKNQIVCPQEDKPGCFTMAQRCDGNVQCPSGYDENNCDSTLCGTHNGTFLCPDNVCIFETWLCDKAKDCSHGADELNCEGTSLKVVTASVIGSLVCAIMIVIAVGCSCKLHTHRLYESLHSRSRYESPMTQIANELLRRPAPPRYDEAMQRSRPFEEVEGEYLAALEQHRSEETARDADDVMEERSVASVSDALETADGSLVELADGDSVSYHRNPNKPPESLETNPEPLVPESLDDSSVTLEPKSDDEDATVDPVSQSFTEDSQSNGSQSCRQVLRRSSIDSDVSLLSRESDDAPLIS